MGSTIVQNRTRVGNTITIVGDWFEDDTIVELPAHKEFDFEGWIDLHLNERTELTGLKKRIVDRKGTLAIKAKDMYEKLIAAKCNDETAKDLSLLVCYKLVVLLDDSTTMKHKRDGERIKTLLDVLRGICEVYELSHDDGIPSVSFFNDPKTEEKIKKDDVAALEGKTSWQGLTRIGTELKKKVLDKHVFDGKTVREMDEPLLVIVITDGEVEGERKGFLEHLINMAIKKLGEDPKNGKDALSIQVAQVGDDEEAERLLERLDKHQEENVKNHVSCLLSKLKTSPFHNIISITDVSFNTEEKLEDIDKEDSKWILLPALLLGSIVQRWRGCEKPYNVPTDVTADRQ
ncbi:hypothetical protein BZA77DRAFT_39340 [Pyronema omphalodes]|nr:hypothetical protein BZA77DRAFT_39340 [Pyronema omphalodes]